MRARVLLSVLGVLLALLGAVGQLSAKVDISKDSYNALAKVRDLIENRSYEEAAAKLEAIDTAKASPYEKALVLQTRGHLHARQGEHKEAIAALEACLTLGTLPTSATQDTRYLLIQMQTAVADWTAAAAGMDTWLAAEKRPSAQAQALAGSIYAQVKRPEEAAKRLRKAIDQSEKPPELWFRQLTGVYLETEQYRAAATLLADRIRSFPQRKEVWLQLSHIYQLLGEEDTALALMELAYQRGLVFSEDELKKLASFLVYKGLPYRAGSILEKALQEGAMSSTADNWQQLSNAWLSAGEIRNALNTNEKALQIAPGAALQLRRAQLAAEIGDWGIAYAATGAALATDGPVDTGAVHLLRGIALHNLDRRAEALEAFQQAQSFETSRDRAEQWLKFLSSDIATIGDLAEKVSALVPDDSGG